MLLYAISKCLCLSGHSGARCPWPHFIPLQLAFFIMSSLSMGTSVVFRLLFPLSEAFSHFRSFPLLYRHLMSPIVPLLFSSLFIYSRRYDDFFFLHLWTFSVSVGPLFL